MVLRRSSLLLLFACGRGAASPPPAPLGEVQPPAPARVEVVAPKRPDHVLRSFFEALDRAEGGDPSGVDVLHLGASHTAADVLTGRLRLRLQERFGDAGRGYSYPPLPDKGWRQEGMSWAVDGGWTAWRGVRPWASGPFGVGGIRLQGEEPGAWWSRGTVDGPSGASFDAWEVHYLDVPGGGSFVVRVDGDEVVRQSTALSAADVTALRGNPLPKPREPAPADLPKPPDVGALRAVGGSVPDGPHELRVELVGDGPVSFLGVSTTRAVPGVRYAALGIEGSTAEQFLRMPGPVWEQDAALVGPELVVLHWGINDSTSDRYWPADRSAPEAAWIDAAKPLADVFVGVLRRLRSEVPAASCLLLLPTDLARRQHPAVPKGTPECVRTEVHPVVGSVCYRPIPKSLAGVREAMKAAAAAEGCATWDQQHAMGGPGSIDVWRTVEPRLASTDGIHLTWAGYRLLADALSADLIEAWERWRGGEVLPAALDARAVDLGAWVGRP